MLSIASFVVDSKKEHSPDPLVSANWLLQVSFTTLEMQGSRLNLAVIIHRAEYGIFSNFCISTSAFLVLEGLH